MPKAMTFQQLSGASRDVQMAWIEQAHPNWGLDLIYIGILPVGADELVEEYTEHWDSYASRRLESTFAKKFGDTRLAEIQHANGKTLSAAEKIWLKTAIITEKLEDGEEFPFEHVSWLRTQIDKTECIAVFCGIVAGQGGYQPDLYGIYGSTVEAEKALLREGYIEE